MRRGLSVEHNTVCIRWTYSIGILDVYIGHHEVLITRFIRYPELDFLHTYRVITTERAYIICGIRRVAHHHFAAVIKASCIKQARFDIDTTTRWHHYGR